MALPTTFGAAAPHARRSRTCPITLAKNHVAKLAISVWEAMAAGGLTRG